MSHLRKQLLPICGLTVFAVLTVLLWAIFIFEETVTIVEGFAGVVYDAVSGTHLQVAWTTRIGRSW